MAPAPVAAIPYSFAEFGRSLHVRMLYSLYPRPPSMSRTLHRTRQRCLEAEEDPRPGRDLSGGVEFHRFVPLCRKFPPSFSGPVAVWIRDFFFRRSELTA